jgi:hypothetical protein
MGWTFYNASGQQLRNTGSTALTQLDIDGGTDIGAAIVDADLFIIDDGAGGTNRKTTAARIETYTALKSTIVTFSRSAAAGSGAQSLTGVGFTPTTYFVLGGLAADEISEWGFVDDAGVDAALGESNAAKTSIDTVLMRGDTASGNEMNLVHTSLDADGCTFTWTKVGSGYLVEGVALFLR